MDYAENRTSKQFVYDAVLSLKLPQSLSCMVAREVRMQDSRPKPVSSAVLVSLLCTVVLFGALSTKVPVRELVSPLWIIAISLIAVGLGVDTFFYARKKRGLVSPVLGSATSQAAFTMSKKNVVIVSLITAAIVTAPRILELLSS